VAESKANAGGNNGGTPFPPRLVGQFILLGIIGLIGWSLYTTHTHDKALAVIEQRLTHIEQEIINLKKSD